MHCPECSEEIPDRSRFCSFCGIAFRRCTSCGRAYLPDAEFCGACGTTLEQTSPRRTIASSAEAVTVNATDDPLTTDANTDDQLWLASDHPELYGFFFDPRFPDRRVVITEGDHTIGAGAKNDIIIDRPAVSWNHALLVARNRRLLLQDSASTNGTYVNRVRVTKPRELEHADLIRFGNIEFRLWIKPQLRNRS